MAIGNGELNFLAVSQCLESIALDSAEMYEDVWTAFLFDKAKALGLVKPLDCAGYCRHMQFTCAAFIGTIRSRMIKKLFIGAYEDFWNSERSHKYR